MNYSNIGSINNNNYSEYEKYMSSTSDVANSDPFDMVLETMSDTPQISGFTGLNDSTTDRGTPIVEGDQGLDMNDFLMLLAVQLANQDPTNPMDTTEMVSQLTMMSMMQATTEMAQATTQSAANDLVGKLVALNAYTYDGQQLGGYVTSVENTSSGPVLNVLVYENGSMVERQFKYTDVVEVIYTDNGLGDMADSIEFMLASSYIGQDVKLVGDDFFYVGGVTRAYRDATGIKVIVDVQAHYYNTTMKSTDKDYEGENIRISGEYDKEYDSKLQVRYNAEEDIYEYRFAKEDGDFTSWKELKDGDEIQGIEFTLPEEKPEEDVRWEFEFEAVEKEEKHFYSSSVLELIGRK